LCKVGIVCWSAGGECVGGSGSLVTEWENGRGREGQGEKVDEKSNRF
jgi:hypothetical protein